MRLASYFHLQVKYLNDKLRKYKWNFSILNLLAHEKNLQKMEIVNL